MKVWWLQLTERERWLLLGSSVIITFLLIYLFIMTPLSNRITHLNQQVQALQTTLTWMQRANRSIQQYRAAGIHAAKPTQTALLVTAEKTLYAKQLSGYLTSIQQPEANQLVLNFKTIPFDALISWLQSLWALNSINVKQISIAKLNVTGSVGVKLVLHSSN